MMKEKIEYHLSPNNIMRKSFLPVQPWIPNVNKSKGFTNSVAKKKPSKPGQYLKHGGAHNSIVVLISASSCRCLSLSIEINGSNRRSESIPVCKLPSLEVVTWIWRIYCSLPALLKQCQHISVDSNHWVRPLITYHFRACKTIGDY